MVGSACFRATSRVGRRFDKRVIIHGAAPSPQGSGPRMDGIFGAREMRDFDIGENTCSRRTTLARDARDAPICTLRVSQTHKPTLVARAIEDVLDSRVTTNNHEIPVSRVRAGTL